MAVKHHPVELYWRTIYDYQNKSLTDFFFPPVKPPTLCLSPTHELIRSLSLFLFLVLSLSLSLSHIIPSVFHPWKLHCKISFTWQSDISYFWHFKGIYKFFEEKQQSDIKLTVSLKTLFIKNLPRDGYLIINKVKNSSINWSDFSYRSWVLLQDFKTGKLFKERNWSLFMIV